MFKELQKCVRDRGPAPIVTWVSDIGRIELSAITFNNAISKASNFLVDGLELEEDATVSISLGNHWQSSVWLGTALTTGLTITDQDPAITFGDKFQSQIWEGSPDEFVVVSRDPFGMPDKEIPAGFVNGSAEVRNFGDFFSPRWSISPDHNVVAIGSGVLTYTQLVQRAQELAIVLHPRDDLKLASQSRVELLAHSGRRGHVGLMQHDGDARDVVFDAVQILGVSEAGQHRGHFKLVQAGIKDSGDVKFLRRIHLLAPGLPGLMHPLQGRERIDGQRVAHFELQGLGQ